MKCVKKFTLHTRQPSLVCLTTDCGFLAMLIFFPQAVHWTISGVSSKCTKNFIDI